MLDSTHIWSSNSSDVGALLEGFEPVVHISLKQRLSGVSQLEAAGAVANGDLHLAALKRLAFLSGYYLPHQQSTSAVITLKEYMKICNAATLS